MMLEFEPWPDRISVHAGDFSDAISDPDYSDTRTHVTGVMVESEKGVFGFAFLLHNWGIGICLRFRPGPWSPDEELGP